MPIKRRTPLRRMTRDRGARRRSGFTILEILVATAILVVGLVGVLALFPAGIYVGKEVVEDSTAIALARSVADAIRKGIRNELRVETKRGGVTYTYFVLRHDGVDPVPRRRDREDPAGNYYILLPRHVPGRTIPGASHKDSRRAAATGRYGKTFVYPESDEDLPNGRGDPFRADDDKDDDPLVSKVYSFGTTLPENDPNLAGPRVLPDQKDEVLKQYSYAFSVRSSIYDANMDLYQGNFVPGDELYHFRVMIFRAFNQNYTPGGVPVEPVYELDFEVAR